MPKPNASQDHRPRVAQMRRERMRQHILSIVQSAYPGLRGNVATLDEVIRIGGISKGTFYKYFPSLEAAASELGAELARQMILDMAAVYEPLVDPVERSAMGFMLFAYRALVDLRWAAFISHIQGLASDNLLQQYIVEDMKRGSEQGAFKLVSIDVAADFVLCITIEVAQKIASGSGSQEMVAEVLLLMLRALGVPDDSAEPVISNTIKILMVEGPNKLNWWPADNSYFTLPRNAAE